MAGIPAFSVLVNSSDGFEDCWDPFFKLYQINRPEAKEPVLLNTERKIYQRADMDIFCTQVQPLTERRLTWSECLLAALEKVKTPLVLYFQEDYFIDHPVQEQKIQAAAAYMHAHPEVQHIALTSIGSQGPYLDHSERWLQIIPQNARYRISTQAALWRVDCLKSYLAERENGWMFEIFGTWRAQRRKDIFLVVRPDVSNGQAPIQYLHTGIIKGKWLPGIVQVFEKYGIEVDFSRRGFYAPKSSIYRKIETSRMLLRNPLYVLQQLINYK